MALGSKKQTVTLGHTVPGPADVGPPIFTCHDPLLEHHVDSPWFRAFLMRNQGARVASRRPRHPRPATVPDWALAQHVVLTGASGSGKTSSIRVLVGQLLASGQSLVALEPDEETIAHVCAEAKSAGLAPHQVTVLSPRATAGIPGWNPFGTGIPAAQMVADFGAALRHGIAEGAAPRMRDLMTNAGLVVVAHELSPYEFLSILLHDDYLDGLLRRPLPGPEPFGYQEAMDYFRREYLGWGRGGRLEAAGPVTNKIRELLRNEFLSPLFGARHNTFDLATLWQRPGVVLVHLDQAILGDEGARLLAGILAHALLRTAQRVSGPVPVNLMLDEMATAESFIGGTLVQILTTARKRNLRIVAACQHLSLLSDALRDALLANTGARVALRLGPQDAHLMAHTLAVGREPYLTRVSVEVASKDRHSGLVDQLYESHPVHDAHGRPLRLTATLWGPLRQATLCGRDPLAALYRIAAAAGVDRLYVRAADTGEPVELRRYVRNVPGHEWWLDGPAPLSLVISFPRPRLTGMERRGEKDMAAAWSGALLNLPTQHAVLKIAGQDPAVIRVRDVRTGTPTPMTKAFLAAALAANGQSPEEVAAARRWRTEQVEWIAAGQATDGKNGGGQNGGGGPERGRSGPAHVASETAEGIAGDGSLA